jgi:16S rRNA processing protein RimM
MLVTFAGIGSRESAAELTNGELGAEPSQLPDAGPGVAYHFQLMGLEVRTLEGRVLGSIADIIATGAHPVYVVQGVRELLIPGTPAIVQRVDLQARTMTVALPRGLEDAMA